jgi:hypothetical protein
LEENAADNDRTYTLPAISSLATAMTRRGANSRTQIIIES